MHLSEKCNAHIHTKYLTCHFKYSISNASAFVQWTLTRNPLKFPWMVMIWWLTEGMRSTLNTVDFQRTKACIIQLKLLRTWEESSRRFSARIHRNEGESNSLYIEKSLGLWRSSKRRIPLRLLMAEWAGKRAKPCSVIISPVLHT